MSIKKISIKIGFAIAVMAMAYLSLQVPFSLVLAASPQNNYYSKKPAADSGVLNEISSHIDSLTIQVKNLNDFLSTKSWNVYSSGDEQILKNNIKKPIKDAVTDNITLKSLFEFLYRDFVSLKVKGDIIKTQQSMLKANDIQIDLKKVNSVDLSYEITLLESTISNKSIESDLIQKDIELYSKKQEELINSLFIKEGSAKNVDTQETEISFMDYYHNFNDFVVAAGNISKKVAVFYSSKYSRFLELKLYCLSQQKKVAGYEITRTKSELDHKKQINNFIKENSGLISNVRLQALNAGLNTREIELNNLKARENNDKLDDSLKKINSIIAEIKKEKTGVIEKDAPLKLKFLNLSLQFEQDLLKHKSAYSTENDDLSKFLVKIANYSTRSAEEETDNIQKLYVFTGDKSGSINNSLIKQEIADYKVQREEAAGLLNYIKSGCGRLESQLKLLRSELNEKEREIYEVTLNAKGSAAEKDLKAIKETLLTIVETINNRITVIVQYINGSQKYMEWIGEKIKTIDNSVKVLSSLLNEIEERLDLKTISEAYSSFAGSLGELYFGLETFPLKIKAFITKKSSYMFLLRILYNALIMAIAGFLVFFVLGRTLFKLKPESVLGLSLNEAYPCFVALAAVRIFALISFSNVVAINLISLLALTLTAYKLVYILLHNFYYFNKLDSELFFRFALFLKYLVIVTPILIIFASLSNSTHLVILAKFLYKTFTLLLALIITKKYSHVLLSYFFISRRGLKLGKYSSWVLHIATLYNHVLRKYYVLIVLALFIAASIYFAGYYEQAFYILHSSFLTLALYSILFLAPKFAVMTFEWVFSEENTLLNLNAYLRFKQRALIYIRVFYKVFFIIVFVIFTLRIWGIKLHYLFDIITSELFVLLGKKLVFIAAIIIAGFLCWHLVEKLIEDFVKNTLSHQTSDNIKKRGVTIAPLIKSSAMYVIWFLGIFLILKEIGVDVTPIIAGAGILGLAVGFGSQNLVKDIVAGLFILFEDQYNVGDYVTIEGTSGTIEEISIRITKIRDVTGVLHIIPNGAISRVSNFSKDFSVSRLEISVAYESDFDKALSEISKLASELCKDWEVFIIEPTTILGIVELADSEVLIRTQTKLTVGKKFDFDCEFRKRLLKRFKDAGIEMPYKRLVVISKDDDDQS